MTIPQVSPLTSNNAVDKHDPAHRRRLLCHLTKAAVNKACKLQVESRRLVHIVDTQSCGGSKGLGLSKPFSAMMKKSFVPSPSQSPSRQWALSKESHERRTVAATIHSLLLKWKADSSSDWQAKVASAVPILEEALYKGAKSKEDYKNPQLLESQLIYVLCHFEAGNGPFLLQGSSPLYSVRASSLARIVSLLHPNSLRLGSSTNEEGSEIVSERISQRPRPSSAQISLCVSSNVQATDHFGHSGCNDGMQKQHSHVTNRFAKKVTNMLAKNTRDTAVTHEVGTVGTSLDRAENLVEGGAGRRNASNIMEDAVLSCYTDSCHIHDRRTLGGLLQLDMPGDIAQEVVMIEAEASMAPITGYQRAADSGEYPVSLNASVSSLNTVIKIPCKADHGCSVSGAGSHSLPDSGTSENTISPIPENNYKPHNDNMSVIIEAMEGSGETNKQLCNYDKAVDCMQRSMLSPLSSLSSSLRPIGSSSSSFSSLTPSSAIQSLPSSSHLSLPQCLGNHLFALPSALQQHQGQYQGHYKPRQLLSSTGLGMPSARHHHSQRHLNGENPFPAKKYNEQVESRQPAMPILSSQSAEVDSPFSSDLSQSTSNEAASNAKGRAVKLPLRHFLSEKEEYNGHHVSEYADEDCPWEVWEEATEQLDGMCCVCMVGLKGAAFIPCGHTFCRRCSRELWKGRGTCPLCNKYIREILDIF